MNPHDHTRWQKLLRLVTEAFDSYEAGLATLRKRVVVDLKRKLRDGEVLTTRGRTKRSG